MVPCSSLLGSKNNMMQLSEMFEKQPVLPHYTVILQPTAGVSVSIKCSCEMFASHWIHDIFVTDHPQTETKKRKRRKQESKENTKRQKTGGEYM